MGERRPGGVLRVFLVAEKAAGAHVLRMLHEREHEVVAVATSERDDGVAGVGQLARSLGIRVVDNAEAREPRFAEEIRSASTDLLLNVYSLHLLAEEVVAAPRIGSFNLHPGPLPGYAGLDVPSWAIYRGERTHGVTLHWMDAGIDTGPIAYTAALPIEDGDTGLTLGLKCIRRGLPLVADLLDAADRDPATIPHRAQAAGERRYFGRGGPPAAIRWAGTAADVVNHVRAADYRPFPSPWALPSTRVGGHELELLSAALSGEAADAEPGTVGEVGPDEAWIAASDEWVVVREARVGGRPASLEEVLRRGDLCEQEVATPESTRAGGR